MQRDSISGRVVGLPKQQHQCRQCGREFWRYPSQGPTPERPRQGMYCSRNCQRLARTTDPDSRFAASAVVRGSCLLWTGVITKDGYGKFWGGSNTVPAHRYAWQQRYGSVPEGRQVLHDCDRFYQPGDVTYRRCVDVDHLFLGTNDDNMADMVAKGRQAHGRRDGAYTRPERVRRGSLSGMSKISEVEAAEIRRLYSETRLSQQAIAGAFGITQTAVSAIIRRVTWAHVPDD